MTDLTKYEWEHSSSGVIVEGFELIPREVYAFEESPDVDERPTETTVHGLVCYATYEMADYIVRLHNATRSTVAK